jgi:hypothetical protein
MTMQDFLNSNLFQTIVIFVTGLAALIIYYLNKYNEKKDAARIIVNEIRIAEMAIQEIKKVKIVSELSVILPQNTWQYKKHLFLNILDQDEINLINDFYYKCSFAEQYRKMVYTIQNEAIAAKSNYLQNKLIDIMHDTINGHNNDSAYYDETKTKLIEMANKESWLFEPNTPMIKLINYLENIIFITPANAGRILKKIAN